MDTGFAGNLWLYLPLIGLVVAIIVLVYAMVTVSSFNKIPNLFSHSKKVADALDLNAKKLADLRNQVQLTEKKKEEVQQELTILKQNFAEAAQKDKDLDQIKDTLAEIENTYTVRLEKLNLEIQSKEREFNDLKDKSAEYERIKQEIASFERKRAEIEQQQGEIAALEQQLENLRAQRESLHVDTAIAGQLQEVLTKAFDKDNFTFGGNSLADGFQEGMNDQGYALAESFEETFKSQGSSLAKAIGKVMDEQGRAIGETLLNQEQNVGKNLRNALDKQQAAVMQEVKSRVDANARGTADLIQRYMQSSFDHAQLQRENQQLRAQNEQLKGGKGKGQAEDAFADLYKSPSCIRFTGKSSRRRPTSESEALYEFKEDLSANGFFFSDRLIKSFHTSLKIQDISPLTVLAGLSGTGKSLLPTRYAKFFGMNNLIISVQPRWDSPQDLLGFYNYLTGKYQATDLAKSLNAYDYAFKRKHKLTNQLYPGDQSVMGDLQRNEPMMLVLLDEMNLARTEYYFSEFLSKLELRRNVNTNPYTAEDMDQAEISLDIQSGRRIWVPDNVLFVGTMNEDETTQTLADKVLDRADVIRFGRPDRPEDADAADRRVRQGQGYFVNYTTWSNWRKQKFADAEDEKLASAWIKELSVLMKDLGRPFGLRVDKSIKEYLMNYPQGEGDFTREVILQHAMSDQIEHKILPKLRGVDVNSKHNELNALNEFVASKLKDHELADSITQSIEISTQETGIFNWVGLYRADE